MENFTKLSRAQLSTSFAIALTLFITSVTTEHFKSKLGLEPYEIAALFHNRKVTINSTTCEIKNGSTPVTLDQRNEVKNFV